MYKVMLPSWEVAVLVDNREPVAFSTCFKLVYGVNGGDSFDFLGWPADAVLTLLVVAEMTEGRRVCS
jgi:hypothetical protein